MELSKNEKWELIRNNIPFIKSVIEEVLNNFKVTINKENIDEYLSCGKIGFFKAINNFDSERGTKITTFAKNYIYNEVKDDLLKNRNIHLPVNVCRVISHIKKVQHILYVTLGREATILEIKEKLENDFNENLTKNQIIDYLISFQNTTSLDQKINNGSDDDGTFYDVIVDNNENYKNIELVNFLLSFLNETEKDIVLELYNCDNEAKTVELLSRKYNKSFNSIRTIYKNSLNKMRRVGTQNNSLSTQLSC